MFVASRTPHPACTKPGGARPPEGEVTVHESANDGPRSPEIQAEGLDGKESAAWLRTSDKTERNHMASIVAKLGVHSRLQALIFALRYGVVEIR